MSSPIFRRLSINNKNRPFRVAVLGQNGVGKSAFTVRVLTQRFIGDYDPLLESTYSYTSSKCVDGETVAMEIRDTVVQAENSRLDTNIKWADAYVLMYAVNDRCSFNECSRVKILISSYSKHHKSKGGNSSGSTPIVLVGNMTDKTQDRMVSTAEGREKSHEMNCLAFHEISVREDRDAPTRIICELYNRVRRPTRRSELQQRLSCPPSIQNSSNHVIAQRSPSDPEHDFVGSPRQRRRRRALYTLS